MTIFDNYTFTLTSAATTFATLIGATFLYRKYRHYFDKVDVCEKFHGGDLVAKVLHSHEVAFIFTLIGGHVSPIVVAAEKMGIRVVDTRSEATAVFAADAAARLSGEIGVAVVTAGPGVTNCVTAAKNAQMAESPVLIIGGAAATILKGRGSLQDIDQIELFQTVCKFCGSAGTVREIVPLLKKAIQIALSGVPGPVFVELPVDTLYQYAIVAAQVLGKDNPEKTLGEKMKDWYLQKYLNNLYAGWQEPIQFLPLPVTAPMPNRSLVLKTAKLLNTAKRPFIVVGSQAMLPPVTASALTRALTQLQIPVSLGGMARGLLGKDHPLQIRHSRKVALKSADVIILAGAICDFRLSYGRSLSRKAKIVTVNRDEMKATMNAGTFWKPTLTIKGDVATFLIELAQSFAMRNPDTQWLPTLHDAEKKKQEEILEESSKDTSSEFLNPLEVLMEVEKQLPDNSIIIGDGGDFIATASYIIQPSAPLSWLDPGPFGTLGVGGGFALGAKLVHPDAQVWILFGDGACGYSIMEFDTFVRHQIPVIAVVGNDACWSQIERDQRPMLGSSTGCMLAHSNYHVVARGLGGQGMMLSKSSINWRAAMSAGIRLHQEGSSVLINVLIARSNFRQGSLSL